MAKTLVYAEELSWMRQLVSAAKYMGEYIAFIKGTELAKEAAKYFPKVYYINESVFEPMTYAKSIMNVVEKENAKIILFPCTNKGRMLAGILASKGFKSIATDVLKLTLVDESSAEIEKLTFGGNAIARLKLGIPLVACIVAGAYSEAEPGEASGELVEIRLEPSEIRVEFQPRKIEGISPDKAEIVIGAGRGFKRKEDLEMVKQLAELLGGAWSVTRPLAADYGWADNWIGISGLIISPKLYIAIGISGQPYHTLGVRGAKTIVAINNDENAPIFEEADYGLVGDLYKILPILMEKLKQRKSR